ncbi:MAG: hypothetical protein TUN42_04445 [Dehalogenimonas sp.]
MSTNVHLAYFVLLLIAIISLLTYLALCAGRGYSVEDTVAHAEKFANAVEEGHGGMTAFVWISSGAILVWSFVYLIMHWQQFAVTFFR